MVKTGVTWSVRDLGWVSREGKDYRGGVLLNGGKPPNWHLTFFCHWHWSGPAFKPSLGPCWKSALCKYGEWALL